MFDTAAGMSNEFWVRFGVHRRGNGSDHDFKGSKTGYISGSVIVAGWAVDGICHPKSSAMHQRRCDGRQP
jgi:hypothetical protein